MGKTRIYQASTSELYGLVQEVPQKRALHSIHVRPYGLPKCMPTG